MDFTGPIGVLISALAFLGSVAGAIYKYGKLSERVRENAEDLEEWKTELERRRLIYDGRLVKAEAADARVERLTDAVKYGSDLTAAQIGNLTQKVAEYASFAKEQFAELRHEQRNFRMALTGTTRRPRDATGD